MNDRTDQQAERVSDDMALATLDLFLRRIAASTSGLGGLHRLAVNDAGRWTRFTPIRLPHRHQQQVIDRLPQPAITPSIEITLNRAVRRKLLRQHAPLATRLGDIEDAVDHLPQQSLARSSARCGSWHMRLDDRPFLVAQVTCIAQPGALIFRARDSSPGHSRLPWCSQRERIAAAGVTQPCVRQSRRLVEQAIEMTRPFIEQSFRVSLLL